MSVYPLCTGADVQSDRKACLPGDSRIFYVLSGEGSIVIRDETFPMKERTFVLINAGIPYQITSDRLLK